jgi:hypothetical protein
MSMEILILLMLFKYSLDHQSHILPEQDDGDQVNHILRAKQVVYSTEIPWIVNRGTGQPAMLDRALRVNPWTPADVRGKQHT